MLGSAVTFTRVGMTCDLVVVESDLKRGLPSIMVTGMLSQEAREAKERIAPAIINSGFEFPLKRITINFSPAETLKMGTHYDLAIAVSILKGQNYIRFSEKKAAFFGELSLSGEIKWVRGILPLVVEAWRKGFKKIFVPYENWRELTCLEGVTIFPLRHLSELKKIEDIKNLKSLLSCEEEERNCQKIEVFPRKAALEALDYSDIKGQEELIHLFLIAASGHHHTLIVGPPGTGKTMCASRLPSIMPGLTSEEMMAVNMIHSIARESVSVHPWINIRPFRAPHCNSSTRALIGGGPKLLPGEISFAHKGILFLDEFLEFHSDVLQSLRTVIEKKEVYLSMRNGYSTYPADFLFIAAANPCPCGYFETDGICRCSMKEVEKYRKKLRNPLTDRIDIQAKTGLIKYRDLREYPKYSSAEMKELVTLARKRQERRYVNEIFFWNGDIPADKIRNYCTLSKNAEKLLEHIMDENILSARGCHKILRLAKTLCDLKDREEISEKEIKQAASMRFLDIPFLNNV